MSRKLSLLFFVVCVSAITACTNLAGPNRDDDDQSGPQWTPEDSAEFCSVTAGTQTCSWPEPENNR